MFSSGEYYQFLQRAFGRVEASGPKTCSVEFQSQARDGSFIEIDCQRDATKILPKSVSPFENYCCDLCYDMIVNIGKNQTYEAEAVEIFELLALMDSNDDL